jgi:signal transduction histidine kinase
MPENRFQRERPVPSDRIVLAGFAGLLILMGALAVDSSRQMRDASQMSATLRKGSRDRDAILDQLRTDTYRSATVVRDYILEQEDLRAANQKRELLAIRSRVQDDLRHYGEAAPPEEKQAIQILKQHSDSYWNSLAPALAWNHFERRESGEAYLQTTIVPRRDELVQFVKQVGVLDERMLDSAEERIQLLQTRFQRRVNTISVLALVIGSILAMLVVRHVRRLGAEAATRFNDVLRTKEDLKRLSDRLVIVQEQERRNLSRELHDDLGQTMSAMLLEVAKLESAPAGSEKHRDGLASVRRLAEENVAKVRNMALLLRPAMLDELGLVPALRWHAKEIGRRTNLRVRLIADDLNDDLPESSRTCIYRVVQEALNNCVKHSKATEVRVVMQRDADGLSISVQDDGVGFDPQHNKGLGLLGMEERVSALGGRFHIESQSGRGTVLSTYFPLEKDQCKREEESVV